MRGAEGENEPKRRWIRRLGPRCVFFLNIRVHFLLINVLFYLYRLYLTKYATERVMGGQDDENGPE